MNYFLLQTQNSLEDVIVTCYRRCLTFPLYRNWDLNEAVFKDLTELLKGGN